MHASVRSPDDDNVLGCVEHCFMGILVTCCIDYESRRSLISPVVAVQAAKDKGFAGRNLYLFMLPTSSLQMEITTAGKLKAIRVILPPFCGFRDAFWTFHLGYKVCQVLTLVSVQLCAAPAVMDRLIQGPHCVV
jgi:hypothetical protein